MKPVKADKPIPAGIVKRAAQVPQPFALFIYLDAIPYCEVAERDERNYRAAFDQWRRSGNLDALRNSSVRYFIRGKDLALREVAP